MPINPGDKGDCLECHHLRGAGIASQLHCLGRGLCWRWSRPRALHRLSQVLLLLQGISTFCCSLRIILLFSSTLDIQYLFLYHSREKECQRYRSMVEEASRPCGYLSRDRTGCSGAHWCTQCGRHWFFHSKYIRTRIPVYVFKRITQHKTPQIRTAAFIKNYISFIPLSHFCCMSMYIYHMCMIKLCRNSITKDQGPF